MTINTQGLSDAARELLVTSLQPQDASKGLITLTEAMGGFMHITAGAVHWTFERGEGSEYVHGINELLDAGFIREIAVDGRPAGYMVTPIGVEASVLLNWPPSSG